VLTCLAVKNKYVTNQQYDLKLTFLQRISIARALYSDADIVLLDDPLSAVDSHVGKHLFHKAVKGYLADKLVLLTANQLQYLPYADNIIFLSEGDVVAAGNFEELMQSNTQFKEQMIKFGVTGKPEESSEEEEPKPKPEKAKETTAATAEEPKKEGDQKSGTLVLDEGKAEGLIGFGVYWYYFKKGGLLVFFTMIFFLAFSVGARVVSGWWLSVWLSNGAVTGYVFPIAVCKSDPKIFLSLISSTNVSVDVGVYGALIGADVIGFAVASMVDVSLSLRASKRLHYGMLSRIIRAPTAFFDITPMGR
jgi:ABC-type multidrug transport system fused ATPase/permease subunit